MFDFLYSFEFQAVIKLLLGFVLAGIIGSERQALNKPAGFKTHSLIGVSSVLVMLCSEYLSKNFGADIARIPAQLLPGIGFIGAGTILRDGFNVKGLTTAASLLVVTCIGLSIGAGFYLGGIIATIFSYFILSHSHSFFKVKENNIELNLNIKLQNSTFTIPLIEKILYKNRVTVQKIKVTPCADDENIEDLNISGNYNGLLPVSQILTDISTLKNVFEVETVNHK